MVLDTDRSFCRDGSDTSTVSEPTERIRSRVSMLGLRRPCSYMDNTGCGMPVSFLSVVLVRQSSNHRIAVQP